MDKSFINVKIIPLGNASASTLAKFAKELDDAFHYNNCVTNVRYVQSPTHIEIGINPKMIHEIHSLFDDPDVLFYMDFYDDVIDCITVDTRLYRDEFVCDVESINTEKALFDIINKMRTRNKRVMFCASDLDEYLNMFCKINEYPLMTGTFRILMHAFFKHIEYKQNEDSLSQVINEATVDLYNKQMKKATEEYKMNEKTLNNPKVLKNIQKLSDIINELKALSDKYDVPIITATQQKNCDKIDDDDNYIKIDGEKANFDGGAIRNTKTGKGRFDLIPADVVATILDNAYVLFYSEGDTTVSLGDLLAETYKEFGTPSVEGYSSIVINIVNWVYTDKSLETKDDVGDVSKSVSYPQFIIAFSDMLKDLAKHYENGAEIYGIDNWKKGIPLTGGDRGGSFTDSMLRHLSQYISATKEMYYTEEPVTFEILYDDIERRFYRKGLDGKLQPEENHIIAAIWNAFGAIWTLLNDKK